MATDRNPHSVRGAPEAPKQIVFKRYSFGTTLVEFFSAAWYPTKGTSKGRSRRIFSAILFVVVVVIAHLFFGGSEIASHPILWIIVPAIAVVVVWLFLLLLWLCYDEPRERRSYFVALDFPDSESPKIYHRKKRRNQFQLSEIVPEANSQFTPVQNFLIGIDKLWSSLKWPMKIDGGSPTVSVPSAPASAAPALAPAAPTAAARYPIIWTVSPQPYILREIVEFVLSLLVVGAVVFLIHGVWIWIASLHPDLPSVRLAAIVGGFFALVRFTYQCYYLKSKIRVVFRTDSMRQFGVLQFRYRAVGFVLRSMTVYLKDTNSLYEICEILQKLTNTNAAFKIIRGSSAKRIIERAKKKKGA